MPLYNPSGRPVFSTVLAADATTIDTGANVIPTGGVVLEFYIVARTDEVAVVSSVGVTFNADAGNNYDRSAIVNTNTTLSGVASVGGPSFGSLFIAGASAAANVAGTCRVTVPGYTGTTFFKSGIAQSGSPDTTAANQRTSVLAFEWRSTAAINQVTLIVTSGSGQKFKAGSALYVYVR